MFNLLQFTKYGDGDHINVAKGKHYLPTSLKTGVRKLKQILKDKRNDKKGS